MVHHCLVHSTRHPGQCCSRCHHHLARCSTSSPLHQPATCATHSEMWHHSLLTWTQRQARLRTITSSAVNDRSDSGKVHALVHVHPSCVSSHTLTYLSHSHSHTHTIQVASTPHLHHSPHYTHTPSQSHFHIPHTSRECT